MENLELYEKVRAVPEIARKEIKGGRLKGMTDINPMWRIKTLTEQFGVCGIGWKPEIIRTWLDVGVGNEVVANVEIKLYVKVDGVWSDGIPGVGGSRFVAKETSGLFTDDEAYKKAYTDALSVACKSLGIGADVYWEKDSTKYDTDNSPYLLWGKRKGENGMSADQIAMELESQGIHIDAINEADIFFEIDSQYRNAIKHLKTKSKDILSESLSKQELHDLRQDIAKEVLRGFDYTGDSSKLAKIVDKYKKQIATLNAKLKDSKAHNRAENRVLDRVQKIKDIKLGTFLNRKNNNL